MYHYLDLDSSSFDGTVIKAYMYATHVIYLKTVRHSMNMTKDRKNIV